MPHHRTLVDRDDVFNVIFCCLKYVRSIIGVRKDYPKLHKQRIGADTNGKSLEPNGGVRTCEVTMRTSSRRL
jgi:hypothetical protein